MFADDSGSAGRLKLLDRRTLNRPNTSYEIDSDLSIHVLTFANIEQTKYSSSSYSLGDMEISYSATVHGDPTKAAIISIRTDENSTLYIATHVSSFTCTKYSTFAQPNLITLDLPSVNHIDVLFFGM